MTNVFESVDTFAHVEQDGLESINYIFLHHFFLKLHNSICITSKKMAFYINK